MARRERPEPRSCLPAPHPPRLGTPRWCRRGRLREHLRVAFSLGQGEDGGALLGAVLAGFLALRTTGTGKQRERRQGCRVWFPGCRGCPVPPRARLRPARLGRLPLLRLLPASPRFSPLLPSASPAGLPRGRGHAGFAPCGTLLLISFLRWWRWVGGGLWQS